MASRYLQPPPPGAVRTTSNPPFSGAGVMPAGFATTAVATVCVALRIFTRVHVVPGHIGWDDCASRCPPASRRLTRPQASSSAPSPFPSPFSLPAGTVRAAPPPPPLCPVAPPVGIGADARAVYTVGAGHHMWDIPYDDYSPDFLKVASRAPPYNQHL